jgi:hypothetical protein
VPTHPSGGWNVRYENEDLQSLRLTCRELYSKTTFDAAIRYGPLLEELEIVADYSGLCNLLHLTQIPAFRDRIERIEIFTPGSYLTGDAEFDEDDEHDDEDEDYEEREDSEGSEDDEVEEDDKEDDKDHESDSDKNSPPWMKAAIETAKNEAIATYIESSEAVVLLAACFDNLKNAPAFEHIGFEYRDVESQGSDCYNLVLSALAMSRFPRKIAMLSIRPQDVPGDRYRALTLSPQTYSSYIKGLQIMSPKLLFLIGMSHKAKQQRRDANVCNNTGYHLQNYSPCHPTLSKFLKNMQEVETLEIDGCETRPRLRFCNGCHDLFSKYIANIHYSYLTCLRLNSVYISGSRLRRFIKQHSDTITKVGCI